MLRLIKMGHLPKERAAMKNIGVICEYNPFHRGHMEQIEIIKRMFGEDCNIIALMSGSVVQRGEVAVYGKYQRAEAAVSCGASLVLEIPYPFSGSCAEIFASAGVGMAFALGNIDYLVFGSECGDIELLQKTASRLSSTSFEREMELVSAMHPEFSYPKKRSFCYSSLYQEELTVTPNDTLGLEYITAIEKMGGGIIPVTYKRKSGYSASHAREVCRGGQDIKSVIPSSAWEVFSKCDPVDMNNQLGRVLLCFCQLKPREYFEGVFDIPSELAGRIKKSAMDATCFEELVSGAVSFKYTRARVKRAILYGYAGVMDRVMGCPSFTNLLGADQKGLDYLSRIRKTSEIKIITKPSSYVDLDDRVKEEFMLNMKADMMFCQAGKDMSPLSDIMKSRPYIRKK